MTRNSPSIPLIIILFILLLILVYGIYRAIIYKPEIMVDEYSSRRMEQLNQLLTSYFGPKWPFVFVIFVVFLFIILFMLYSSTKGEINLDIPEESAGKFRRTLLWIGTMITVTLIGVTAWIVKNLYLQNKAGTKAEGDYTKYNINKLTQVILLGIFVIILLIVLLSILHRLVRVKK